MSIGKLGGSASFSNYMTSLQKEKCCARCVGSPFYGFRCQKNECDCHSDIEKSCENRAGLCIPEEGLHFSECEEYVKENQTKAESIESASLQKENEWEKELGEHLNWLVTAQFMENPYKFEKESPLVTRKKQEITALFYQAITTAVSNREKEIAEEVKKLGNDCQMNTCGCGNSHCEKLYKKILSIIKHSSQ